MTDSILDSVKKVLSIPIDDTAFDQDVIFHINSVFSTLNQLGVGPEQGFSIEDKNPTWSTFLGTNKRLNNVKSYMYLRVRLLFDPPTLGYVLDAMKQQITEQEWRLNVTMEETIWTDPNLSDTPSDVLDGGIP